MSFNLSSVGAETADEVPAFLAVDIAESDGSLPMALTYKAMQWQEPCWLLNLEVCQRYWQTQANWHHITPPRLLSTILQKLAGDSVFRAAAANDPWTAVLLLQHMKERSLTGFLNHADSFGRSIYQQVSWTAWIDTARQFAAKCRLAQIKGFNENLFREQLRRLQQTMQRLAQQQPFSMPKVDPMSIRRRYGEFVALLWQWTFTAKPQRPYVPAMLFPEEKPPFHSGFPWISWTPPIKPHVTRHLDDPLWQWDHLEALLSEDCDRLCQAEGWQSGESVLHLTWELTLDDTATLMIPIRFRHPHKLHQEIGQHKTTLLQARYAFAALFRPGENFDDLNPPRPIIGWTLTVQSRMMPTLQLTDLFGHLDSSESSRNSSLRLENQLPLPIERYSLTGDWLPEASFASAVQPESHDPSWNPWLAMARQRPLYIYREPQILAPYKRHRCRAFLERTTEKWWPEPTSLPQERDYFVLEDRQNKWFWAYKDAQEQWWVHGVFG